MPEEKKEQKEQKEEVKKEEQKEKKEEIKEEKEKAEDTPKYSIFVSEDDVFDVSVGCYKEEGRLFVEDLDDDFDAKKDKETLTLTLRYPSQADVEQINMSNTVNAIEEFDARALAHLEFTRLLVLAKEWSLKEELNNSNILKLHPRVVKALIIKIREKIAFDGIL